MRLAFLASHNGSAALAIHDACLSGVLKADPVLLVTNNENCNALSWAKAAKLKTAVVNAANSKDVDGNIANLFSDKAVDLVICSGYMRLIGPKTIASVRGAILNIHPALLPKYGGKGMYGSHVHKAVFDNKDTVTGVTIHLVDPEYDRGRIIGQKTVAVSAGDSAETIENNVKAAEAGFYIETLQKILSGALSLK